MRQLCVSMQRRRCWPWRRRTRPSTCCVTLRWRAAQSANRSRQCAGAGTPSYHVTRSRDHQLATWSSRRRQSGWTTASARMRIISQLCSSSSSGSVWTTTDHSAFTVSCSPNTPSCSQPSWRRGVVVSGVRRMNLVNARRARLVPGWVTVCARVYHLGM